MHICLYVVSPCLSCVLLIYNSLQRVPMAKSLLSWATMRSFPVFFSCKNVRELKDCFVDSCAGVQFKTSPLSIKQMARRRSGLRAMYLKISTWH